MFRVLTFLLILFVSVHTGVTTASAAPFASLKQASQTASAERNGIHVLAFYDRRGDVLDLTILITDTDGEALRTRVGMRNRQHHALLLPTATDGAAATRVEFMRTGDRIEILFSDNLDVTEISTIQASAQF